MWAQLAPDRTNIPSGARLAEFGMRLHGVTPLLEVLGVWNSLELHIIFIKR
jgi:hypothetical protein